MKHNEIEDKYVWEHELNERLMKLKAEQQAESHAEKTRLRHLHAMHCPKCGQKLMTGHHGPVEIDLCPSCRGLWLDAEELETILANESGFLKSCLRIFDMK